MGFSIRCRSGTSVSQRSLPNIRKSVRTSITSIYFAQAFANELSSPFPSLCPTLFHRFRQPLSSLVGDAAACLCIRGGQLRIRGSPRPGEHSVPRSIRLRVRFLQGCYSSIEPLPFIFQIFDDFLDVQLSSFASSDPLTLAV